MNIKQVEKEIKIKLKSSGIEDNEAKVEAKMLMRHVFALSDVDFLMKVDDELEESLIQEVLAKAELRASTRQPIQHIIGFAHFMGEDFMVNEDVLIPRDETELLVLRAVQTLKTNSPEAKSLSVLDIGSGSGCISCMVAKLTKAHVLSVDISTQALSVALENASHLGLEGRVLFRKSDLFANISNDEKFDLIVSNPPYIPEAERENLQHEVKFEPDSALFTKDIEGIEFYDKIIKKAPNFLNNDGYLMFELGIGQSQLVKSLMKEANFKDILIEKDLAGIDRVISGRI